MKFHLMHCTYFQGNSRLLVSVGQTNHRGAPPPYGFYSPEEAIAEEIRQRRLRRFDSWTMGCNSRTGLFQFLVQTSHRLRRSCRQTFNNWVLLLCTGMHLNKNLKGAYPQIWLKSIMKALQKRIRWTRLCPVGHSRFTALQALNVEIKR